MNKKGVALLFNIFVITALLILGTCLMRIVFSATASIYLQKDHLCAFYRAEGALEAGKSELKKNPNWYTDLPATSKNTLKWLKDTARGQNILSGAKTVKERGKDAFYGVGYCGRSCAIIKFENGSWEEL